MKKQELMRRMIEEIRTNAWKDNNVALIGFFDAFQWALKKRPHREFLYWVEMARSEPTHGILPEDMADVTKDYYRQYGHGFDFLTHAEHWFKGVLAFYEISKKKRT